MARPPARSRYRALGPTPGLNLSETDTSLHRIGCASRRALPSARIARIASPEPGACGRAAEPAPDLS